MKKQTIEKLLVFILILAILGAIVWIQSKIIKTNEMQVAKEQLSVEEWLQRFASEKDENLQSTKYLITDDIIARIRPETKVEDFKNELKDTVKIYQDETCLDEVTQGYIGTGMALKIEGGQTVFKLSVIGDLTKDGIANQIEITKIIRHIEKMKNNKLEGVDFLSGDITGDNQIDKKDVKALKNYLVFGRLEVEEIQKVNKPTIEIVSGTQGSDNWYLDEVELKITQTNTSADTLKTVYKIEGTVPQDIKEITGVEETIRLDTEGAYKITAYTYGKLGNKSETSSQVIKINRQEIIASVSYDITTKTNTPVIATVSFNTENVTLTNNNGNLSYQFTSNGSFTFEYQNQYGRTGSIEAVVDWIGIEEKIGTDGQWKYFLLEDGTAQVSQYLGSATDVMVPTLYEGYPVTAVGNANATMNTAQAYNVFGSKSTSNTTIKSITIPEGIKHIRQFAFNGCSRIKGALTLPSTIETIETGAFRLCSGITGDLNIPEGVTTLKDFAFFQCTGLNGTLTLPSTLKEIGQGVFYKCSNITGDLQLPEGLTQIGKAAFYNCGKLTGDLVLPSTLQQIADMVFYDCVGLTGNLVIPEGITKIEDYTFRGCSGLNGTLSLPSSLTYIGYATFAGCNKLTGNLSIPETVTYIGGHAFNGCTNLEGDLVIPEGVTYIGNSAFNQCTGFKGTLTLPSTLKYLGNTAFHQCKLTGELTLPEGLEFIGDFCFSKCTGFTNSILTIPASVKTIGGDANQKEEGVNTGTGTHMFYNFGADNSNLVAFEVPESNSYFKTIDGVLFTKDGNRLIAYPKGKKDESYTIPEGVTIIDQMSIASNINLKNLTIPDSYTIKIQSFNNYTTSNAVNLWYGIYNYTNIRNVYVKDTNPNYVSIDGVIYSKDMKTLLYCSTGRLEKVIIPDGVETIVNCAIYNSQLYYNRISELYIPASVTTIGYITGINDGVTTITISPDNPKFTLNSNGKLIKK